MNQQQFNNSSITQSSPASLGEYSFSILIYSKFSKRSDELLDIINTSPVNFSQLGLSTICADNKEIRKRILSNKDIVLKYVPCILVGYSDGRIDKYDGNNAKNWIFSIIDNYKKKIEQDQTNANASASANKIEQVEENIIEEHAQNNQEIIVEKDVVPKEKIKKKPVNKQVTLKDIPKDTSNGIPKATSTVTSIDDLEDEEVENKDDNEDEEVKEFNIKRPPMPIRTNAGNIEFNAFEENNEFGDATDMISKSIKNNNANDKRKNDILNAAQMMQKERDSQFESSRPAGFPLHKK